MSAGNSVGEALPLAPIDPGTTLFVAGPSLSRADDLARALVLAGDGEEGSLFVSTNQPAGKLLDECERLVPGFDPARTGVVDCTGQESADETRARVETVSTPGDLTGIGIEFSMLYETLHAEGVEHVRAGVLTVSTLLMYADLRAVFRFMHTLSSRISTTDGVGVFVIDPDTHDEQTVNTLNQVCDGRVEVQETDAAGADGELRVRGLDDQPREWTEFSLSERAR
ncbi:MAG: hypothetical protein ABEJ68_05195 [Halobacteriaceae archaeon]